MPLPKCVHILCNTRLAIDTFTTQVPIQWEPVDVTPIQKGGKTVIPDAAINSVKKNTVALKGTPPSI